MNQRGSIIPVIAFLFGAAVVVLIFGYMLWPKASDLPSAGPAVVKNSNAGVNANANTDSNVNSAPEVLPAGVKRFTSDTLGITFTYLETAKDYRATVKEIGDKVYIHPNLRNNEDITSGQWVQVMPKDVGDTLTQAINKRFLIGIDPAKCYIENVHGGAAEGLLSSVSIASIRFPTNDTVGGDPWINAKNCPDNYTAANGVGYFWMDSEHPDKLLFFSIGQYGIQGLNDNYQTTWEKTVRITGTYDPTAGWKTYTSASLGFSLKVPTDWNGYTVKETNNAVVLTHPADSLVGFTVVRDGSIPKGGVKVGEKDGKSYYFASIGDVVPEGLSTAFQEISVIRSTFQFTDPTAGWKTYTNSTYGYSFKYPSNWKLTEYNYSSSNPLSGDVVAVKDPTDAVHEFMVCPDNRGTDCPPSQDAEYSSTDATGTIGGKSVLVKSYTLISTDCSSCSPQLKAYNFSVRPAGWRGTTDFGTNRDILSRASASGSFEVNDQILFTFTFTK